MTYLTLPIIKRHLNVDASFTGDDDYITTLGDTCEQIVEQHLEQPLSGLVKNGSLPAPITHAMLLLLATLYMSREHVTFGATNQIPVSCSNAFDYLLHPYLNYRNSAR